MHSFQYVYVTYIQMCSRHVFPKNARAVRDPPPVPRISFSLLQRMKTHTHTQLQIHTHTHTHTHIETPLPFTALSNKQTGGRRRWEGGMVTPKEKMIKRENVTKPERKRGGGFRRKGAPRLHVFKCVCVCVHRVFVCVCVCASSCSRV